MRIFFLFIIFFNFAFGIKDYLVKPNNFIEYKILYNLNNNYPERLDKNLSSDKFNIFNYLGHFRVIFGKDYDHNNTIKKLAINILNIANNVWDKEINEFGFKIPRHSDQYYIDIYIGNTNAYNEAENKYVSIQNYYAGYTEDYYNYTPYFVINPNISLNLIKVTIAHEFFHTIQYAYGVDLVNNDIWNKNKWFLEATAVLMECEVYPNIIDYINYLKYYLPYINKSLDLSNGMIEYGKVLFAKFLVQKFGINFIKQIFENYNKKETLLESIKNELAIYNISFDDFILDYGKCLANISFCFKKGNKYPKPKKYMIGTITNVGKYGIVLFSSGSNSYLISSTPYYLQSDFLGNKNVLENINDNGLIFIAKKNLNTNFLIYNNFNGYILKRGWNLISNIFNQNINFKNLNVDMIWVLRNGKYCAYSNHKKLMKEINNLHYECKKNFLMPGEGAWIYMYNDKNLTVPNIHLLHNDKFLNGIRGFSGAIETKDINYSLTIWFYDNKWLYYSNKKTYNYKQLNILLPGKGYFIK